MKKIIILFLISSYSVFPITFEWEKYIHMDNYDYHNEIKEIFIKDGKLFGSYRSYRNVNGTGDRMDLYLLMLDETTGELEYNDFNTSYTDPYIENYCKSFIKDGKLSMIGYFELSNKLNVQSKIYDITAPEDSQIHAIYDTLNSKQTDMGFFSNADESVLITKYGEDNGLEIKELTPELDSINTYRPEFDSLKNVRASDFENLSNGNALFFAETSGGPFGSVLGFYIAKFDESFEKSWIYKIGGPKGKYSHFNSEGNIAVFERKSDANNYNFALLDNNLEKIWESDTISSEYNIKNMNFNEDVDLFLNDANEVFAVYEIENEDEINEYHIMKISNGEIEHKYVKLFSEVEDSLDVGLMQFKFQKPDKFYAIVYKGSLIKAASDYYLLKFQDGMKSYKKYLFDTKNSEERSWYTHFKIFPMDSALYLTGKFVEESGNTNEYPIWYQQTYVAKLNETTGIHENSAEEEDITIFPNPVSDEIGINATKYSDYEIYNVLGNKVSEGNISNNRIPSDKLTPGVYHLLIKDDSGNYQTLKFIKSR